MIQDTIIYLLHVSVGEREPAIPDPTGLQSGVDENWYFTTAGHKFVWNGKMYRSGFITSLPNIKQTSLPRENSANFEFYDAELSLLSDLETKSWRNKKLTLTQLFLNPDGTVGIVNELYSERMRDYSYDKSTNSRSITITCKDIIATKGVFGRQTNNDGMWSVDKDDNSHEFTPWTQDNQPWGREGKPYVFESTEPLPPAPPPPPPPPPPPGEDLP